MLVSVSLCLVSVHAVILSQCLVVNYGGNVLTKMGQQRSIVKSYFVHLLINRNSEVVNFVYSIYFSDFWFYLYGYSDNVFGLKNH